MYLDQSMATNVSRQCASAEVQDAKICLTSRIFYAILHEEIQSLLKASENGYGISCLRTSTIRKYLDKMREVHFNVIGDKDEIVQEMFILYETCKVMYSYNQMYLRLSYRDFRARILYPNLIYILYKFMNKAHRFLRGVINSVYNEISKKSWGMIKRYTDFYYADNDVIKTDVLYEFLGNTLRKIDPLTINTLQGFYKGVFRNIFGYHFKKEYKMNVVYSSIWDIDTHISSLLNIPTRLLTYRDVLYSMQVEKMRMESPTLGQLNYNYSIFKKVVVDNELQNMFFACTTDSFMLSDKRYKLMKIYDEDSNGHKLIQRIKELPTIYKLLKCIHVVNPKAKPYNEMMLKPDVVKAAVLCELTHAFRGMIAESHILGILTAVAENFTNSLLSGEYLNLLTLSSFRIKQLSFIEQVKKFVQICIDETIVKM